MEPEVKQIIRILFAIIAIILLLAMSSCEKQSITPGNYYPVAEVVDSSKWQDDYVNGGVLPTFPSGSQQNNELVGTVWVLTFLQIGFSIPPLPIDTIKFISNTRYTINNGSARTYQLYSGVTLSSKTLILNYHYPFGSGNYSGQVASTFVDDGVILNTEFFNTNSSTTTIKASFLKI